MLPRILIVDDDTELSELVTQLLQPQGYEIETQALGVGASERAVMGHYALVILDVMLPDRSGFDVLRDIRRRSSVPVILLTARGDQIDRVVGLEIGADDYIPKPFDPRELTARIRAVLRRTQPTPGDPAGQAITLEDVVLDPGSRTVSKRDRLVDLTSVEFNILRVLLESAGQTVARDELTHTVLGRRFDPLDRSIDVHISKLRRKLGERSDGTERIKSIRGAGYIYVRGTRR